MLQLKRPDYQPPQTPAGFTAHGRLVAAGLHATVTLLWSGSNVQRDTPARSRGYRVRTVKGHSWFSFAIFWLDISGLCIDLTQEKMEPTCELNTVCSMLDLWGSGPCIKLFSICLLGESCCWEVVDMDITWSWTMTLVSFNVALEKRMNIYNDVPCFAMKLVFYLKGIVQK